MPTYCCLFNHYNSNKTINSYVFKILDYFASLHCETILISNSPVETEEGKNLLRDSFKGMYVERENTGYDFGAWQYAIKKNLVPPDVDYLFLVNDSVFGPLSNIDPILQKMNADHSIDFWGLTDSYENGWHLQSYFLCFKRNVFLSDAFNDFFNQDFHSFDKDQVINYGEISLTTKLQEAGFKGKAFVDYNTLVRNNNSFATNRNPMLYYAVQLIERFNFPFIKKAFVINNSENVEVQGGILKFIEERTPYPVHCIEQSLIDKYAIEDSSDTSAPLIDVICHVYYLQSAYDFLEKISRLKKYNCRFFFNLSDNLYRDAHFIRIVTASFDNCTILHTSNIGKDIGGKIAIIDTLLRLKQKSNYSILLHDKHSPHTSMGKIWKEKLFRIVDAHQIVKIITLFSTQKKVGIIAAGEFIMNEYNSVTKEFDCTCNEILKKLIQEYKLENKDFNFVGGTMLWMRSEILHSFFMKHSPLEIRGTFEKGNVLDTYLGTETHAWERMLSWIAIDQGYTILGINE